MRNVLSGPVWIFLYLAFCLAPLLLALGQGRPTGRAFLVLLLASVLLALVRL